MWAVFLFTVLYNKPSKAKNNPSNSDCKLLLTKKWSCQNQISWTSCYGAANIKIVKYDIVISTVTYMDGEEYSSSS